MTIREQQEQLELQILSPYACPNAGHAKRERPEMPCPYRTAFQRDRDRILHCNSFRRLKRKTQVFLSPVGDHYRTRLTHTLEVAQIARTISRALRFNEDLTEAIALGHDLGHSPFGHSGEAILNRICPHGYRHYEQSLRVVERLEKGGAGLNLTEEVRTAFCAIPTGLPQPRRAMCSGWQTALPHEPRHRRRYSCRNSPQRRPATMLQRFWEILTRITTLVGAVVAHGPEKIGMAPEIQAMHDKPHIPV
ncbi:MAG: HD domain-containing protein [Ruminococcus sp.]